MTSEAALKTVRPALTILWKVGLFFLAFALFSAIFVVPVVLVGRK